MYVPATTERFLILQEVPAPTIAHPECAGGVTFVLYQRVTESGVGRRVTGTVTGAARCSASGAWVPAMAWTDDMERAFRHAAGTAPKRPAGYRFHRRFLVIAGVTAVVLAAALAGLWRVMLGGPGTYAAAQARVAEVAASPEVGDRVLVSTPDVAGEGGAVWHVVREAAPEAVRLQAYREATLVDYGRPDLDPGGFTGPALSVSPEAFLRDGLLGLPGLPYPVLNAAPADD